MKIQKKYISHLQHAVRRNLQHRSMSWERLRAFEHRSVEVRVRAVFHSPYLYIVAGIVLGLIVTLQIKNVTTRPLSSTVYYSQLIDLRKNALADALMLKNEVKTLQDALDTQENNLTRGDVGSKDFSANLLKQQMLLGTTALTGDGVVVVISDGELQIKDEFAKSLTHAADLRDIVNLLWYAGAEAISINGERIVYNTSIDCIVSTIMINTNHYVPPFTVQAIGNTRELSGVLHNSRKLIDIKKRAAKKQIDFTIKSESQLRIEKSNAVHVS